MSNKLMLLFSFFSVALPTVEQALAQSTKPQTERKLLEMEGKISKQIMLDFTNPNYIEDTIQCGWKSPSPYEDESFSATLYIKLRTHETLVEYSESTMPFQASMSFPKVYGSIEKCLQLKKKMLAVTKDNYAFLEMEIINPKFYCYVEAGEYEHVSNPAWRIEHGCEFVPLASNKGPTLATLLPLSKNYEWGTFILKP